MSSEFSVYDFSCLATTSVNSIGNNLSFSIYPNPASDVIYFDLNENEEDVEGSIINSIGQTVLTYQHLPQEINIDNLKPGLYTIVIQNETVRRMLKFIKE